MVPCSRKACTEEDPGTPIQVAGGTYPARIWREVMTAAHAGIPTTEFAEPPVSAPPTTFLNLTLFPLIGKCDNDRKYLTLREAVRTGVASVREISEGGSVP